MPKVLVELKDGAVANVVTTSEDIEVYVIDHDVISGGSIGEMKRYLSTLDSPIEVEAVLLEDDLMARLEEITAEGKARLEDLADAWDDESEVDGELPDVVTSLRRGTRRSR